MGYQEFFKLKEKEKSEVFDSIASEINLPSHAIEKDWWVVQTLRLIFNLDEVGNHLLFKGGTSLSKAWNLIERFSEDIDLALNREFLGFDPGPISKSQIRKLRSASFKFISGEFNDRLKERFEEVGLKGVKFGFENLGDGDQDPVSILINYPAVTEHTEYLPPRIKVEIGSRSLKEPFTKCEISSLVTQEFPDKPFSDQPLNIPSINPERTFLEKLYLLHEEFQRPKDKIRVDRLSRHLYDIQKIGNSEFKDKAFDKKLIKSIIEHRRNFNAMKGVDYGSHYPGTLNPIPPDEYMKKWVQDYQRMQELMIYGESLSFEALLSAVKELNLEYNYLNQG